MRFPHARIATTLAFSLVLGSATNIWAAKPQSVIKKGKESTARKNRAVREQFHRLLNLGREGFRSLLNRSTGQLVFLDKGNDLHIGDRLMLSANKWTRRAGILYRTEELGDGVILTYHVSPNRRSLGYWARKLTGRGWTALSLTSRKDRSFLKRVFPELNNPDQVKQLVDQVEQKLANGFQ